MATVTGLTAERMIEMENATVISGHVDGTDLILVTKDATEINAGSVQGPVGPSGASFIVCTSTTRPTPGSGEAGKAIYETDTKLVRIWDGTRWKLQEKIICTSTTRPAMVSADEGVKIYETDTNSEFSWTGTSWAPSNAIPTFTNASDRTSKWASPPVGALSYLADSPGILWLYEAGTWRSFGEHVGTLKPTVATNAPPDHVLCYGQTLVGAATAYPALWAVADTSWRRAGVDLAVPDLRGRIPVGKDNMGGVTAGRITAAGAKINGTVMGNTGGDEYMQAHQHNTGQTLFNPGLIGFAPGSYTTLSITAGYGSGNSENVQPSIILNWILKIQ